METRGDAQTASMQLAKGEESGPLGNEHPKSLQVLVVVAGEVEGQIGERRVALRAGDSAIVLAGEAHRFVGASEEPAITLNTYVPPAY
ncbi:MAG TPA: cupin domain-containing protein [Candidatus Baltobacteraceae bacterium]|jgi:quercetin dioxygenase-like cupin family protein